MIILGNRTDDHNFKSFHRLFCKQNYAFAPVQAGMFQIEWIYYVCFVLLRSAALAVVFSTISIIDACFRHKLGLCYHTTIHCIDH